MRSEPRKVSERVWVGPYMEPEEMVFFLEERGISVVISLLGRNRLEERLFTEEYYYLESFGVKVLRVPIDPFLWDENHKRQLRKLIQLTYPAKVYVHSYLGRFRVKLLEDR